MTCELCEREVERLTSHHLVPRLKGGKHGPQAKLCPTCHHQVHALFSEGTLTKQLNSIEALKAEPQVASYLSWVKKQSGSAQFRVWRWKGRY
jgi:hypothetical protein